MPIANDPFNSLTTIATYTQPDLVTEAYSESGLTKEVCVKTPDGSPGPGGIRVTADLERAAQWLDVFAKLWAQASIDDQTKYIADFPDLEPNPLAGASEIQFLAASLRAYEKRDAFLLQALQGAMNATK
jgi:hypothetical protein